MWDTIDVMISVLHVNEKKYQLRVKRNIGRCHSNRSRVPLVRHKQIA